MFQSGDWRQSRGLSILSRESILPREILILSTIIFISGIDFAPAALYLFVPDQT